MKNFIDEMTTLNEVATEMKKIGKNYFASEQIESRFLADWMYRFGEKIIELEENRKKKPAVKTVSKFVKTLEKASYETARSQMKFKQSK